MSYIPYDVIKCKHCKSDFRDNKNAEKLYDFLSKNNINFVKNCRTLIYPYEIDVFIPQYNLGIELNGNFWHSELSGKDKNYHINKTKLCFEKGVNLIHIFEDELLLKWDIVKSRILNLLKLNKEKVYARTCIVREIDTKTKKVFLNKTHIQGNTNSSINLGLFRNDKLVSVMTFNKERIFYNGKNNDNCYELVRFSSELNMTLLGAFSKMLTYFIKKYNPEIIKTYSDIRWGGINNASNVYALNGFIYCGISKPNYWYMHKNNLLKRYHRYNFAKHHILEKYSDLDRTKTEWELMQELGYNRIWDCGNMKFEMRIKKE